ncbi:Uncharacterised protein [Enterobacter hormaechei]|uniref:hypothetical protein n=1 Tax=Enterobacter hormaechei TaxID=158836 RepID=UPI000E064F96|nr:hypothetical protein [Enterobacter hormaechei]STP56002.1 Uncharacterised protein [Enterobacter hormaechei]
MNGKSPAVMKLDININTKEIMNLWSEDKIKLGYSRRERSELEAHKWWYVESKKGGFVLKTSMSYNNTKHKYIFPSLSGVLIEASKSDLSD